MASELSAAGYQDLRTYINTNWAFIELRNAQNDAILRLGTTDPRVSWKHAAGAQELILQVEVSGSDSGISLPLTVAGSAIFKGASGGNAMSADTFTPVTLEDELDKVTIQHKIQIPEIVS